MWKNKIKKNIRHLFTACTGIFVYTTACTGIFLYRLYGDEALDNVLNIFVKLLLSIPQEN